MTWPWRSDPQSVENRTRGIAHSDGAAFQENRKPTCSGMVWSSVYSRAQKNVRAQLKPRHRVRWGSSTRARHAPGARTRSLHGVRNQRGDCAVAIATRPSLGRLRHLESRRQELGDMRQIKIGRVNGQLSPAPTGSSSAGQHWTCAGQNLDFPELTSSET